MKFTKLVCYIDKKRTKQKQTFFYSFVVDEVQAVDFFFPPIQGSNKKVHGKTIKMLSKQHEQKFKLKH